MTNLTRVNSVDTLALLEDPSKLKALMDNLGVKPNAEADEILKRTAADEGLTVDQYLKLKPVIRQWSCLRANFSNFEQRIAAVLRDHRPCIPVAPVWACDLRHTTVTRKFLHFFKRTENVPVVEVDALISPLLQVAAQIVAESLSGEVRLVPVILDWRNDVIVDDAEKRFLLGPWNRAGLGMHHAYCPPYVLAGEFCFRSVEADSDLERFGTIVLD
jgi:hypothetical protein